MNMNVMIIIRKTIYKMLNIILPITTIFINQEPMFCHIMTVHSVLFCVFLNVIKVVINMYTSNTPNIHIAFNEYQKKYHYDKTTISDYYKWLMDSFADFHNGIPIEKYSGDVNIYGVIFKG